ncbi:hypothetical protein [Nocardioides sp. T2.26MG-1]|uniref:hypothetical protein n=1 Tax=Nocardioides sp. T2.26MG-1 TaxID=3041166 RepID=UPI0024776384|nr:hypothetical protein [Nocardioides sp. T2.26MG-1]CAI9406104.1 hypothetical protein HIDPHFAB_04517 [Nocardioides sp. T2.26MG-1]
MQDWIVPVGAGALALLALGLGVALLRARSRTDRAVTAARAETAALRAELEALERRLSRPDPRTPADAAEPQEYVITHLGEDDPDATEPAHLERALFADLVLRETVVKAASLAHGVRRALAPETRNRIRFEMRREVKRARKQRRSDTRQARREWQARQRADDPNHPGRPDRKETAA